MSDVNRKMAAGIAWMSLMRLGVKGLGLISTVVLARLLVPGDFGLVAMAMSVVSGLELFRAFSFDVALIQKSDADRSYYDTAWTLNVLFGVALALILLGITPFAAEFFKEPRLQVVMQLIALGVFVSGFENIGVVAFRKDLDFRKEFLLRVVQKACSTAICLSFAFLLKNYWALVIGTVADNILGVLITYVAHPFRPRFSLAMSRHLVSFSKWLLATNVLYFFRDRGADYVLGRVAGASTLGLFTISVDIANLPTAEIIAPINRAVLPAYAKMAHDLEQLRQGFLNVIGFVLALALPAGFGIAVTSDLIVNVLLGTKWAAAAPTISILAISGAINALQTNSGVVHYAMGRPRTVATMSMVHVLFLFPSVVWAAYYYGAIGIAWANLAAIVAIVPANFWIVLRRLHLSIPRLLAVAWRPIVATGVMYVVTGYVIALCASLTLATLLFSIAAGAAAYFATLMALWFIAGRPSGPEQTVTNKVLLPFWTRVVS
jgi:O-antigen/teichoic acid export membrane protein